MRPDPFKLAMAIAAALVVAGSLSSCVTQQQYRASIALAKNYQAELHDKEDALARVEAERDRLKAELQQNRSLVEAAYSPEAHARMSELQAMIDELGRPPGDIEVFDVGGGTVYMIQEKILFASGSAEIQSEGRAVLTTLAREIQGRPHGRVFVRGHTDSDPVKRPETLRRFPHGNIELSAARAVSVGAALVESGVASSDVVVVGFGPHQPVAPNNTSDSKRLNRRVEIFVSN